MKYLFSLVLVPLLITGVTVAQPTVSVKNATKHLGETVTVCEKVFGGKVTSSNSILLQLGGYEPNQTLTILIPGHFRSRFKGNPEIDYRGKDVIATGKMLMDTGRPEMIVDDPSRLKLVLVDNVRPQALKTDPKKQ